MLVGCSRSCFTVRFLVRLDSRVEERVDVIAHRRRRAPQGNDLTISLPTPIVSSAAFDRAAARRCAVALTSRC